MDSLFDLLFACRHRRTTFPLTPARKKGAGGQSEKPGDTYVVCLECGKQFIYDWENMRLGKGVDISDGTTAEATAATPPVPFRTKSKIRYLFWGSAVSAAALVLGKAAHSRRRSRKLSTTGQNHGQDGDTEKP